MLRIVRCNDPFFSARHAPGRIAWSADEADRLIAGLIDTVRAGDPVALPYAEHLFTTEARALRFLEAAFTAEAPVTFFCREMTLPSVLVRYALIEEEPENYQPFAPHIAALPFSPAARETVTENISGFPYSRIEEILSAMRGLPEPEAIEYLLDTKRNLLRRNPVIEVVKTGGGIEQIGGLAELKQWIVERRGNFSTKAREFGIPMPKGLLMLGVQGCGKSLTAKTIANIWNFPLARLDFVNLFQQGKSVEELIRDAVAIAEAFAPIVLWIDEIEKALFQEEQSAEIRRVLGWLMTWMQEKSRPVFLVATANNVEILPPELLRKGRFDEIFFIDLPGADERTDILRIHLTRRGRDASRYDIAKLAEAAEQFSGAELEQVVVDALIADYAKGRELAQKTLEEVLRRTVPLAVTYEEQIKKLRMWSRGRARNASGNQRIEALFNTAP